MIDSILAQVNPFDGAVMGFVQQHFHSPVTDAVFPVITYLGEAGVFWLTISLLLLFFRKTRKCGMFALCAVALGFLLGELTLKNIVCRPRPFLTPGPLSQADVPLLISPPTGYSFPSGHTTASFAAATVYFRFSRKWGAAALVLAALIGLSRIFLFVHWPTDVLAGIVLGVLSAILTCLAAQKVVQKREQYLKDSFPPDPDANE